MIALVSIAALPNKDLRIGSRSLVHFSHAAARPQLIDGQTLSTDFCALAPHSIEIL